jgi:hypothetical protein
VRYRDWKQANTAGMKGAPRWHSFETKEIDAFIAIPARGRQIDVLSSLT